MVTRIQSIHFDADLKLISLIEEKIARLAHYVQDMAIEARVILKLEHVGKIQDKIIEVIINLPGQPMIVKSTRKSFEEALSDVMATLKKQLTRYKERIQEKHKDSFKQ
ncbi:MAG: ribosome-associated translation inhibitor RaiA [Saprospiraceae bacterium]|nr:ribosome-associated translation inhibitor RaiA [Saprospiraceae bacterium]